MNPTIIVHGGAGPWEMESERMQVALMACKEAAVSGQRVLYEDNLRELIDTKSARAAA